MDYRQTGRIIKMTGGLYTVQLNSAQPGTPLDGQVVECRARGNFRHEGMTPLVGDHVAVQYDETSYAVTPDGAVTPSADRTGLMIAEILDRKNALIRPPLANLDEMLVVFAAEAPAPDIPTIDKLLCILEFNRIRPVMVIGKSELNEKVTRRMAKLYRKAGYEVYPISCYTGEGLEELKAHILSLPVDFTVGLAGASGVGKSTLLNTLFPELSERSKTAPVSGEISHRISRGKNTTRHTELFPLAEGHCYIADTAGFSLLDFERFDFFTLDDLAATFPEFEGRIGSCRYTDCTHLCEEGCAVVEAVKNKEISASRHESYKSLYAILKEKKKWK
ncbi:MAG: ribosome small subunit-dependent GTPase A [Ruminococcaceae bacterium]|nr:ribosome small subunit-dependent GTPase A [Oscillospiraceae bacterium]